MPPLFAHLFLESRPLKVYTCNWISGAPKVGPLENWPPVRGMKKGPPRLRCNGRPAHCRLAALEWLPDALAVCLPAADSLPRAHLQPPGLPGCNYSCAPASRPPPLRLRPFAARETRGPSLAPLVSSPVTKAGGLTQLRPRRSKPCQASSSAPLIDPEINSRPAGLAACNGGRPIDWLASSPALCPRPELAVV